jgi:hypothetical protein
MSLKSYTALLKQSGSGNIIPITSSGNITVTYYREDTGSYYFTTDLPSVTVQLSPTIISGSSGSTADPLSTYITLIPTSGSLTGSIYSIYTYDVTLPTPDGDTGRATLSDGKFDYTNTGIIYALVINEVQSYV